MGWGLSVVSYLLGVVLSCGLAVVQSCGRSETIFIAHATLSSDEGMVGEK